MTINGTNVIYEQNISVLTCAAPSWKDASKSGVVVAVVRWKSSHPNIASKGDGASEDQNGDVVVKAGNTLSEFRVLTANHKQQNSLSYFDIIKSINNANT